MLLQLFSCIVPAFNNCHANFPDGTPDDDHDVRIVAASNAHGHIATAEYSLTGMEYICKQASLHGIDSTHMYTEQLKTRVAWLGQTIKSSLPPWAARYIIRLLVT